MPASVSTHPSVRNLLAAAQQAFPDVAFAMETYRQRGKRLFSWTGGPPADTVQQRVGFLRPKDVILQRHPSQEEYEAIVAKWDAQSAAHAAAAPERKAAGIAKRKTAAAERKVITAVLKANYPSTAFSLERTQYGSWLLHWAGGPQVDDVIALGTGIAKHACLRTTPRAEIEAERAYHAALAEEADRLGCAATEAAIAEAKATQAMELRELRRAINARLDAERRQLTLFPPVCGFCAANGNAIGYERFAA